MKHAYDIPGICLVPGKSMRHTRFGGASTDLSQRQLMFSAWNGNALISTT